MENFDMTVQKAGLIVKREGKMTEVAVKPSVKGAIKCTFSPSMTAFTSFESSKPRNSAQRMIYALVMRAL